MSDTDLFRLLAGLLLLLVAAHLVGRLFARLRQPPVIGEILGGLILGPTMLGQFAPAVHAWLFPSSGMGAAGLDLVYHLGLLLLMFSAGLEMRTVIEKKSRTTVVLVAIIGMLVPFGLGLAYIRVIDTAEIIGPANNSSALILIVACAIAVTSIPVISRIMLDLGIIRTSFARTVLSVAVLEDIALNVVISIALGMVAGAGADRFGAASLLGFEAPWVVALYHSIAAVGFFAAVLLMMLILRTRRNKRQQPRAQARRGVAPIIATILACAALCLFLGVAPMLGAFSVGLLVGWSSDRLDSEPLRAVRGVASGFFIPIYFAVVGLKLDLVQNLDLWLTVSFIGFACLAKSASVYLAARISGNAKLSAWNLAVALNTRGGPGIVLATLAFDAGIVNGTMFTTLILTAIATSLLAGVWLDAVTSRGLLEPDPNPPRSDAVPAGRPPAGGEGTGDDPAEPTGPYNTQNETRPR